MSSSESGQSASSGGYPQPFPAYPAAPPPWASAPPPARRRRSRWLTVGLPVGGVLLLGGCAATVGLLVRSAGQELGPANDAAGAYAQALVDERWDAARDLLCAQDRARVTAADLAAHYAQPDLTGYRVDGVNVNNVNGQLSGRADVTFTTADGLTDTLSMALTREDDEWRACP